ncbi:MAG: hypothetical protein ACOCYO_07865, partial [Bacteroidota bacterium]
ICVNLCNLWIIYFSEWTHKSGFKSDNFGKDPFMKKHDELERDLSGKEKHYEVNLLLEFVQKILHL